MTRPATARCLRLVCVVAAFGGGLSLSEPAAAQAPTPASDQQAAPSAPSPWHLDFALGTVVPMDVGGRVTLQGPARIRLSLGAGTMPGGYVDIINSTAESLELYQEAQSKLIEDSLYRSTALRAALGWIPWEEWGFYFDVGYAFQGLGGRSSPGEVVRAATNIDPPITGLVDLDVQANLHILTVDLGYKWFFAKNLFLQGALGGEFTMAATSKIEPEFGLRSIGVVDRFIQSAEGKLNDILESNVHHPTLTLLVGARGF